MLFNKMHISLVNIWQDDQICSDPDLFWAKTWNEQSGCSLIWRGINMWQAGHYQCWQVANFPKRRCTLYWTWMWCDHKGSRKSIICGQRLISPLKLGIIPVWIEKYQQKETLPNLLKPQRSLIFSDMSIRVSKKNGRRGKFGLSLVWFKAGNLDDIVGRFVLDLEKWEMLSFESGKDPRKVSFF